MATLRVVQALLQTDQFGEIWGFRRFGQTLLSPFRLFKSSRGYDERDTNKSFFPIYIHMLYLYSLISATATAKAAYCHILGIVVFASCPASCPCLAAQRSVDCGTLVKCLLRPAYD